jgi:hypothetical protein
MSSQCFDISNQCRWFVPGASFQQVLLFRHTDLQQMQMDNICGVDSAVIIGLPALFDCGTVDWMKAVDAVNYVSTAALEEALLCRDRTAQFTNLMTNVPELGDFRHSP